MGEGICSQNSIELSSILPNFLTGRVISRTDTAFTDQRIGKRGESPSQDLKLNALQYAV